MNDRRFQKPNARSDIPTLPEIWILVKRTRDKAGYSCSLLGFVAKDERKRCGKGGGTLSCWKGEFENIVTA